MVFQRVSRQNLGPMHLQIEIIAGPSGIPSENYQQTGSEGFVEQNLRLLDGEMGMDGLLWIIPYQAPVRNGYTTKWLVKNRDNDKEKVI